MFNNSNDKSSENNATTDTNKYNLSNVLKHIYTLTYDQRSNQKVKTSNESDLANNKQVSSLSLPTTSTNASTNSLGSASGSSLSPTNSTQRQFWMKDDQVKECFECNEKFTTFRRRHVTFSSFSFVLNFNNVLNLNSIVAFAVKYFAINVRNMKYQVN
jgi:hypothetical protein